MAVNDPDDPLALPEHLKDRPADRYQWDFPTAWLLGTQLVSSLRDIAWAALSDHDDRDWMAARAPIELASRAVPDGDDGEAFWIDFLADTGDSPRLVYQLAYLLQQESLSVLVKDPGGDRLLAGPDGAPRALRRGQVLVFGGDTAYPVATRHRLVERVRAPFIWARNDLQAHGLIGAVAETPPVTLLGVPGNHDYYNDLSGFERMFHAAEPADAQAPAAAPPLHERVDLPGYQLAQRASYFAANLPFGWQLWGLDTERDKLGLDERQARFFETVSRQAPGAAPPRRIVVASRPAVVYHALGEAEPALRKAYQRLGLPLPFRDDGQLPDDQLQLDLSGDVHLYERYWGRDAAVATAPLPPTTTTTTTTTTPATSPTPPPAAAPPGARARRTLDRRPERWPEPGEPRPPGAPRHAGNELRPHHATPQRDNYASVVSGLGGAFHHPSQVRFGTMAPRCAWPSAETSARAVGERLLRPRKVFQAGAVGAVGFVLGAVSYFTTRAAPRTANMLDVPFRVPESPLITLGMLGLTASLLVTLALIVGAVFAGFALGARLARPVTDMEPPRSWFARATHAISHHRLTFWLLRWLGANRRNVWVTLITAPAWLGTPAVCGAAIYALLRCPMIGQIADGHAAMYVLTAVISLAMFALGALLGGQPCTMWARSRAGADRLPWSAYVRIALGRLAFGLFGLLIALLVIWTPHAWTRLAISPAHRVCALWLLAYPVIRALVFKSGMLTRSSAQRRVGAVVAFLAISALYCVVPWACLDGVSLGEPPLWGFIPAAVLSAYLACLWVGWYFFVCLQFDGHANEAGGGARVVTFAEFVRIKLTATRAEVWAIAAEVPPPARRRFWQGWFAARPEPAPTARLIDHFVLEARDGRRGPPDGPSPADRPTPT